jgi:hypothetical protein
MSNHMNINVKSGLILGTLIVVALLAALWASSGVWFSPSPFEHRPPPQMTIPGDIEFYYTAKTLVTSINVTLSLILLFT